MKIDYSVKNGVMSFDDFIIDETLPLHTQLDNLKEDMIQIEFPNGYILDVGWRPSFSHNGEFKIILIKNFNWNDFIYSGSAKNISDLEKEITTAIDKVEI